MPVEKHCTLLYLVNEVIIYILKVLEHRSSVTSSVNLHQSHVATNSAEIPNLFLPRNISHELEPLNSQIEAFLREENMRESMSATS